MLITLKNKDHFRGGFGFKLDAALSGKGGKDNTSYTMYDSWLINHSTPDRPRFGG